jgi:uncharacterized membrane protein YdbT with pleckstrin-like domain
MSEFFDIHKRTIAYAILLIMINPTYQRRGHKTFLALIIMRMIPAVLFLCIVIVLTAFKNNATHSITQATGHPSPLFVQAYNLIIGIGFLLFILLAAVLLLSAWLEYISFKYYLDDNAFKIQTGIININEISILYHQIQNVDVDRPLLYRMMGMSRLVIFTAAHEDEKTHPQEHDETEAIIDLIDNTQAESLQQELLSRSNVQKVEEVKE